MAKIPKIRVNTPVPFPALVQGSGPITLTKNNGVWTVGISFTNVAQVIPPPANKATDLVLVWDTIAKTFISVTLSSVVALALDDVNAELAALKAELASLKSGASK